MSAVYQVIISFVLLVTVSAYTANLAAFLTVSAKDVSSVTSLRQLIYEDRAACVAHDSAMRPTYEAVYPHMRKDLSHGQYEILDALRDKKCDAVVMARDLYDFYKMDTRYCHLSVIETLFPARLGWAVQVSIASALASKRPSNGPWTSCGMKERVRALAVVKLQDVALGGLNIQIYDAPARSQMVLSCTLSCNRGV